MDVSCPTITLYTLLLALVLPPLPAALTRCLRFQDFQHAVEGSKQVRQNKEDDEIQALKASITR